MANAQTDTISGVINQYTQVTNIDYTDTTLTVADPNLFNQNDKVLLIQMRGATYNTSNTSNYGSTSLADRNGAGSFDILTVCSRDLGTGEITFNEAITKSYATANFDSAGLQLVSVPVYANNVLVRGGTLTAQAWNGQTGGVLIFEAAGQVRLEDNIDVSGLGFRGGQANPTLALVTCGAFVAARAAYVYGNNTGYGGMKGEGIAAYQNGFALGRGRLINGGGGGNDHDSGGGGGSNYGTGGAGGEREPSRSGFGPFPATCRGDDPGVGGLALNTLAYSVANPYLMLGGGGGGGHQSDGNTPQGGNGGGVVIIKATQFDGNNFQINANGTSAGLAGGDGASGGGAGGTVLLDLAQFTGSNLTIHAEGGNGGDSGDMNFMGPGGGGGGGVIWSSIPQPITVTTSVVGGNPGTSIGTPEADPHHGAASGGAGAVLNTYVAPTLTDQGCLLPLHFVQAGGRAVLDGVALNWEVAGTSTLAELAIYRRDIHSPSQLKLVHTSPSPLGHWSDNWLAPGRYDYQFVAMDLEGILYRSPWVSVAWEGEAKLDFRIGTRSGQLLLKGIHPPGGPVSIEIRNTLGQKIQQMVLPDPQATFSIQIPFQQPAGTYIITLKANGHQVHRKVIYRP